MRKQLFFLILTLIFNISFAQKKSIFCKKDKDIETVILEIDLSQPSNGKSLTLTNKEKKLLFNSNQPLQVNLKNGNPFRYKYLINFEKVNLFTTTNFTLENSSQNNANGQQLVAVPPVGLRASKTVADIINAQNPLITKIKAFKSSLEKTYYKLLSSDKIDMTQLKQDRENAISEINDINTTYSQIKQDILDNSLGTDPTLISNNLKVETLIKELIPTYEIILKTPTSNYLLPIDVNGDNIDYVEITLQRFEGENSEPETYTYKLWVTKGFKIDFSGGGFITSLQDRSYSLVSTERTVDNQTETGSLIFEDDLGDYNLGFGAVANITYRNGRWIKPTLTIGTILNSDQDFQIITGGGIIIGKNERFIFHAGLAMGKINTINNRFQADGTTFYDIDSNSSVPTLEKFEFGHFFGITYNFSSAKKGE